MCDAAEVAERRKPGVRRREALLDVLLLRFSKMRRDFLIQIAIDVTRMQKAGRTRLFRSSRGTATARFVILTPHTPGWPRMSKNGESTC